MIEDIVGRLQTEAFFDDDLCAEAAKEIERLRAALDGLLCEAEDVFNCMADATGIDRFNYPKPYLDARAALAARENQ
jgi:hypothetical protein